MESKKYRLFGKKNQTKSERTGPKHVVIYDVGCSRETLFDIWNTYFCTIIDGLSREQDKKLTILLNKRLAMFDIFPKTFASYITRD